MRVHPIIKGLQRHKAGVAIIVVQIAITLVVVSNALFVISGRIHQLQRPTGMRESGLYLVTQTWINAPDISSSDGIGKLDAMQRGDVASLRNVQGVTSVSALNSLPLLNATRITNLRTSPDDASVGQTAALYYSDENTVRTLGLKLVSGRDFLPTEMKSGTPVSKLEVPVAIITQELAKRLYPNGNALGSLIFMTGQISPTTIIGIVDRLQVPGTSRWFGGFAYNSVLIPCRLDLGFSRYAVRVDSADEAGVVERIRTALFDTNQLRVIQDDGVQPFSSIRETAYQSDANMVILMMIICMTLLTITGAGIFGLNSFWVSQRRKQIGLRRALGATRLHILKHFLAESLIISATGALIGLILSIYCNRLLMKHMEMDRMPWSYPVLGFVMLVIVGQCAAFIPSRRASVIAPIVATKV